MLRLSIGLGVAGTAGILATRGVRDAVGFLAGAALSIANLRGWVRLVGALGVAGETRPPRSAALLGLRYLLAGGVVYAIIELLGSSPAVILAGLFVSVAAVLLELVYELIAPKP